MYFFDETISDTHVRTYHSGLVVHNRSSSHRKSGDINYHVASWPVRGHVRHYKSGKTVWIKERTSHRRGIKETETKTIIEFTG